MTAARGVAVGALVLVVAVARGRRAARRRRRHGRTSCASRTRASSSRTTRCRSAAGASARSSDIELTDDNQAEITISVEESRAAARGHDRRRSAPTSLSGVANRYIALDARPELRRASSRTARRSATDAHDPIVDIDQLFNTLDPTTRKALQQVIKGSRALVRGQGRAGQQGGEVLQPGVVDDARGWSTRSCATRRRSSDFLQQHVEGDDARSAERRDELTDLVSNANATVGRDRRRERCARPGAALPARHAAQGQHDVRQPARDARRPRRARGRVQARDEGPRAVVPRAAPARRDARPAVNDLSTLVRKRGRRERPDRPAAHGAEARAARASRRSSTPARRCARPRRCSASAGPTRPSSSPGCATSARARPTTTPTATTPASSRSSSRTSSPTRPRAASSRRCAPEREYDGLQKRNERRCPGAATQPAADGSTPCADRRLERLRPQPGAARPMKRVLAIGAVVLAAVVLAVVGTRRRRRRRRRLPACARSS